MTNTQKFIAEMQKKKIPAKISEFKNGKIYVELGWNYPDRLCNKVFDIADKYNVPVEVMADFTGGDVINVTRTGGGPKSY